MKFPWQSKVMLENPWLMILFLVCLALLGSIFTWFRQWQSSRNNKKENVNIDE